MNSDIAGRIRALAARQDGLVTIGQSVYVGLTTSEINRLRRAKRWIARQLPVSASEVVIVDGLPIRRGDLTTDELQAALALADGRPGIQQLRTMALLADGRAESMVESCVRLACIDGNVPPDDLQYAVLTDDGHTIAIGDLGWHKNRPRPLLAGALSRRAVVIPE